MDLREAFELDPDLAFLNHAASGATPRVVSEAQRAARVAIERDPVPPLVADHQPGLDSARAELAAFLGTPPARLVLTPNATTGHALLARSLAERLQPGDEVVVAAEDYGATLNLWRFICERTGAQLVTPALGTPVPDVRGRAGRLLAAVTERTKVLVVSHVTSDGAVRLPVAAICAQARAAGVFCIVDGAHVPGHMHLDLAAIDCDAYVASIHKWICSPRPTGFLYAPEEVQRGLDPLAVSWSGSDRATPLAHRQEMAGTTDPTGWLAIPAALEFHGRHLAPRAAAAHALLRTVAAPLEALGCEPVTEELEAELLMRSWVLPAHLADPFLSARLRDKHRVEVQIKSESAHGPILRVAVAWYTTATELERLLAALQA
jgi:isopenicillin-N epimerase